MFNSYSLVVDILDNVIAIAMLAIGMNSIINGELTVGTLLLFISVEGYFVEPVVSFVRIQLSLQDSVVSFARLDDILNIENEEEEWNHTKEIRFKDGDIEFKNLCFEYNNKIVFENKTFFIKQGITTAIVGKSGCGKTTLAKLLVGFYKCNQGDIKVSSKSIIKFIKEYRKNKTTIFILHNKELSNMCDSIIKLDGVRNEK